MLESEAFLSFLHPFMDESSIYMGSIQIRDLIAKSTYEEKIKEEKNPFLCCLFVN